MFSRGETLTLRFKAEHLSTQTCSLFCLVNIITIYFRSYLFYKYNNKKPLKTDFVAPIAGCSGREGILKEGQERTCKIYTINSTLNGISVIVTKVINRWGHSQPITKKNNYRWLKLISYSFSEKEITPSKNQAQFEIYTYLDLKPFIN